jgi:hypothetical protein
MNTGTFGLRPSPPLTPPACHNRNTAHPWSRSTTHSLTSAFAEQLVSKLYAPDPIKVNDLLSNAFGKSKLPGVIREINGIYQKNPSDDLNRQVKLVLTNYFSTKPNQSMAYKQEKVLKIMALCQGWDLPQQTWLVYQLLQFLHPQVFNNANSVKNLINNPQNSPTGSASANLRNILNRPNSPYLG